MVLQVVPEHLNITCRMAQAIPYTDDYQTILFSADVVRQLRNHEWSGSPKSKEELQRIIKTQCNRVHPYLYMADDLKLADWTDPQWLPDRSHHLLEPFYRSKLAEAEQKLSMLEPTRQELDWIRQHAQWQYDKEKHLEIRSPLGLVCRINAMEICIARKSHELSARQPSATPTTEAAPFSQQTSVPVTQAGNTSFIESFGDGASEARLAYRFEEVRYIADLPTS